MKIKLVALFIILVIIIPAMPIVGAAQVNADEGKAELTLEQKVTILSPNVNNYYVEYSWILLRKYDAAEPSFGSWGNEESAP